MEVHWQDLAIDFGLNPGGFERPRAQVVDRMRTEAGTLRTQALAKGWHRPCIDTIDRQRHRGRGQRVA